MKVALSIAGANFLDRTAGFGIRSSHAYWPHEKTFAYAEAAAPDWPMKLHERPAPGRVGER